MDGTEDISPPDLRFPCSVFDITFHPKLDIVAVALVSGSLQLFQYAPGSCKKYVAVPLHTEAIRSCAFNAEGDRIYTGSSDRSVKCLDTSGTLVWGQDGAHETAVNVVCPLAGSLIATGDESGEVKIWDTRVAPASASAAASAGAHSAGGGGGSVVSFTKQKDVITGLLCDAGRATLLATSGDGSLGVYDLRRMRLGARSEPSEDELLSLAALKGGAAVVTGTQEGVLLVWDWGTWTWTAADEDAGRGFGPERFKGHPASIDALLPVDDDTLVTGSSDGLIRLVTVRPNKLVGVLGEHGDDPVEALAWARDRRLLASASHDQMVRFWDVSYLQEEGEEGEEDGGDAATAGAAGGGGGSGASKFTRLPALALPRAGEEGDDSEDSDSEADDEGASGSDDEEDSDGDGAAAGGSSASAAAGAGGSKRAVAAAAAMEEDSDEHTAPPSRGARGGGRGGGKVQRDGRGGRGAGGGAGGGGFFSDL